MEVKELVCSLDSASSDDATREALQEFKRTKSKTTGAVKAFREAGGTSILVELVKSTRDDKIARLAVSAFADCCREPGFQAEIRENDYLDVPSNSNK